MNGLDFVAARTIPRRVVLVDQLVRWRNARKADARGAGLIAALRAHDAKLNPTVIDVKEKAA